MAPFEALYNRRCRSPIRWFDTGEAKLIGPYLMHQSMEKVKIIKEQLKMAQSYQNSYSDVRRRDLEFKDDDWVFLMFSLHEGYNAVWKEREIEYEKVIGDPSLIVPVETSEVNEELSYEEISVSILDRKVRKLRNKEISTVKVL
ncbi:uncharacterized protein [Nicotiana sylvestris]|uniref:uncharacterized protein n=1 Tax=Nicotiana sylvestris TaxID=4096 RepID=UPI00388C9A3F